MTNSAVATQVIQIIGESKVDPSDVKRLTKTPDVNPELVKVYADTILWSHKLLRSLPLASQATSAEKQKVMAAVFMARVIEAVESSFLLASRGACVDTAAMVRVFLDAYFVLANFCSSEDFIDKYINTDAIERQKLMNAASKHESVKFQEINNYATPFVKSELKTKIETDKILAFNSFEYAQSVGCSDIYDSMYRIYSTAVHSSPRILDNLVKFDNQGRITHIFLRSESEATNRLLEELHCFFCDALKRVCVLFNKDTADVQKFESRRTSAVSNVRSPKVGN